MKFDKRIPVLAAALVALITYSPLLLGIIAGSAIVAFKAGIGCRYSSAEKKAIYALVFLYFSIATTLGVMLESLIESLTTLLNYTIVFHVIIAILLIFAGYITIRKASCGVDISNKTFLAIAIPCPACFAAIFISCFFASQILEIPKIAIGAIVGAIIALGILVFSFQRKENPERLGKIMLLLGVYYLLAILLIPSVIQGMSFKYSIRYFFDPYSLILLIPIALGAIRGALRYA